MSRRVLLVASLLALAMPSPAIAQADRFAGTWEGRVAWDSGAYTMRLRCRSASDCDTVVIDDKSKDRAGDIRMSFPAASPFPAKEPLGKALAYALEHKAESLKNREFAAIHKQLAVTVTPKTELDTCIGLDPKDRQFFVVCTIRNPASFRPALLFFGSMIGLCGQGFCKYVVYPLVRTGS